MVRVLDASNYTGPFTAQTIADIQAADVAAVIVRLSTEDDVRRSLSVQQCAALAAANIPRMGYVWAYWTDTPEGDAGSYGALARECGVRAVWIDAEARISGTLAPSTWIARAAAALRLYNLIVGCYTYTYWPPNVTGELAALGNIRWWIANANGRPDIEPYGLYPGAVVTGHQYGLWTDSTGQEFDLSEFIFDPELAAAISGPEVPPMDEATARAIVTAMLNELAANIDGAATFEQLLRSITLRIAAAGAALSVSNPVPPAA